ncbi:MAG TPA: phosphoribosylformylglycinamidine synthase subunit PurS [Thermoplasmata archaeon]|nr:phosphoribosylformylglycinamidine synthase subunit PurS [Thermoplasmata archaeon]
MGSAIARTTVEVRVELKPGVFDAEGDGVLKALRLLGIDHLKDVTTARVFRLAFEAVSAPEAERLAARAVDRLLANPVVHRVQVTPAKT